MEPPDHTPAVALTVGTSQCGRTAGEKLMMGTI